MFFKNWPHWLKGGLIGLLVNLLLWMVLLLGALFIKVNYPMDEYAGVILLPLLLILMPTEIFRVPFFDIPGINILLIIFTSFLYFLAGAFIASFYGKVKNRNKN